MDFKKIITHFFVLVFFALAAVLFFYPVLQGKTIYQSDIVQYRGMAHEQDTFRSETSEEPYWTNSAFGGMPTYQLGAQYPHAYVKKIDLLIRFLPRPADYLFLYFLSFYILMCCLGIETRMLLPLDSLPISLLFWALDITPRRMLLAIYRCYWEVFYWFSENVGFGVLY